MKCTLHLIVMILKCIGGNQLVMQRHIIINYAYLAMYKSLMNLFKRWSFTSCCDSPITLHPRVKLFVYTVCSFVHSAGTLVRQFTCLQVNNSKQEHTKSVIVV